MSTDSILNELTEHPQRFEFFQALRVLLASSEHGRDGLPEDRRFDANREPIRVGAHQDLAFPTSEIASFEPIPKTKMRKMLINFLGLTGPSGVLPQYYTQFLSEKNSGKNEEKDLAPAEFLDIFNHRIAMLFYYAWEKYRFPVTYERRPEHDFFRHVLFSLVGVGSDHLRGRPGGLPDDFFARYAALLAIQPRSACALRGILTDFFEVPVEVEQFVGTWYPLEGDSVTRFAGEEGDSDRVGYGVVVGQEYYSQESMVRLRIGPLSLAAYKRFLQNGPDFMRLREICRFFSRDEVVFEAQLILQKDQVPDILLDGANSELGWTTWAKSKPFREHAEQVVIRL